MTEDDEGWSDEKIEKAISHEESIAETEDCNHPEGEIYWDRTAPMEDGAFLCKKCGGWL